MIDGFRRRKERIRLEEKDLMQIIDPRNHAITFLQDIGKMDGDALIQYSENEVRMSLEKLQQSKRFQMIGQFSGARKTSTCKSEACSMSISQGNSRIHPPVFIHTRK